MFATSKYKRNMYEQDNKNPLTTFLNAVDNHQQQMSKKLQSNILNRNRLINKIIKKNDE